MKMPSRRRSTDESEETDEESPAVGESPVDITIPRECIYKFFKKHPGPCPRCGGPLQQSHQIYMIATRRGRQITDSFIANNDAGWFCTQCPTVVINSEEVSESLQHGLPHWDIGDEFAVLGIVDLDAIPAEKRDLPLGGDENPYPLVEFTRISDEGEPEPPAASARSRPAREARSVSRARDADQRESALPFEERYEDVLQNIEFGIIQVYHDHPEMTDWDALSAVEALIRMYQAEAKGRQARPPSLTSLPQEVYQSARAMCELRLGRETLLDEDDRPVELGMQPLSLDEIIACLKRIRKSINLWSREGGRRGYLAYVDQFIA